MICALLVWLTGTLFALPLIVGDLAPRGRGLLPALCLAAGWPLFAALVLGCLAIDLFDWFRFKARRLQARLR